MTIHRQRPAPLRGIDTAKWFPDDIDRYRGRGRLIGLLHITLESGSALSLFAMSASMPALLSRSSTVASVSAPRSKVQPLRSVSGLQWFAVVCSVKAVCLCRCGLCDSVGCRLCSICAVFLCLRQQFTLLTDARTLRYSLCVCVCVVVL